MHSGRGHSGTTPRVAVCHYIIQIKLGITRQILG